MKSSLVFIIAISLYQTVNSADELDNILALNPVAKQLPSWYIDLENRRNPFSTTLRPSYHPISSSSSPFESQEPIPGQGHDQWGRPSIPPPPPLPISQGPRPGLGQNEWDRLNIPRPPPPPTSQGPKPGQEQETQYQNYHDKYGDSYYFFSWKEPGMAKVALDWSAASQYCKRRCMEAVSIESWREHQFLARHLISDRVRGAWTSGRKCDFPGCDRMDLSPVDVYGWFWAGSSVTLPPTTNRLDTAWSNTGIFGRPQPDNAYPPESCLAILNGQFNDEVTWHDESCNKRLPFICEVNIKKHNFCL